MRSHTSHSMYDEFFMKQLRKIGVSLLCGCVLSVGGCHHPEALYRDPDRSPLEHGRLAEQQYDYAAAAVYYADIDDALVQEMTLNQLLNAWESVNGNIAYTQQLVKEQPRSAKAHLRLAEEYYKKGILHIRYTTGLVGDYPRDFIFNEQEYFFNESLKQANKALSLQADSPEAHLLIGEIYLANRRSNDALSTLKTLIAKHPDFAKGYYAIGKVYLDLKEYPKVERYFIRTIKLDAEFIDAYYLLGKFYFEQTWYDLAAYTFLEILRKKPNDTISFDLLLQSCHELAKVYIERKQYAEAIRLLEEAINAKASYKLYQTLVLARQKQQEAIAQAKQAETPPPDAAATPEIPVPAPGMETDKK